VTFAELIASDAPDFVVLAEVQPMEVLQNWTAAGGGLTNTYSASYSSQIATSVVPGGIYRRLDEVRHNATRLTSRASAALVDANLGSYFYDTANSRIYVSISGGAHPDTAALIGAWFTLFFSSTSVSFSDQPLYAPMVAGELPTLESSMPDSLFGASQSDSGTLTLLNGDGLFEQLSRQYVWRNKIVTFRLGGQSLAYTDYLRFDALRINAIDVSDETMVLTLEDYGTILNKTLPLHTWGDGTVTSGIPVANPAAGINGEPQPIVLGLVERCPLAYGGLTVTAKDAWYAFDGNLVGYGLCQFVAVYALNRSTLTSVTLTDGIDFTTSGAVLTIINATYTYADYDILADLQQLGTLVSPRFGTMALAILRICGTPDEHIDLAAFTAADVAAPQILARYIGAPVIAADLLRELEQSVNGQVYLNNSGVWSCRVLTPDIPAGIVELAETDFVTWEPDEEDDGFETVLTDVRVRFANRPFADEWLEASASSDATIYGIETIDTHRLDTWLTVRDDATALAHHLRFFRATSAMLTRSEQRGLGLISYHVGDLVSVTRTRAPVARTGRYDGHILRIVRIRKALGSGVPTVTITLTDLDGQVDRIFRLAPSGSTMTWSTATAQEKARYGFLGDTSRYVGGVKDQKVLW
jgi:hypothetical protein